MAVRLVLVALAVAGASRRRAPQARAEPRRIPSGAVASDDADDAARTWRSTHPSLGAAFVRLSLDGGMS